MKIRLINKGDLNLVSGGYIYNKEVFNGLTKRGYEIDYTNKLGSREKAIDLVDSLMFEEYLNYHSDFERTFFIIHQLPNSFCRLEKIREYLKYIVTGTNVKNELVNNWNVPSVNVLVVEPGIEKNWKVKQKYRKQPKDILMVANYIPNKGFEILPSILESIEDMDWHLKIFGNKNFDGHFFNRFQEKLIRSGFDERVTLNSVVDRRTLNKEFVEADVLLHCSREETYGMVVFEAIRSGLPSIMYKTGSWETFVETGWAHTVELYSGMAFGNKIRMFFEAPDLFYNFQYKPNEIRTWNNVIDEFENILLAI